MFTSVFSAFLLLTFCFSEANTAAISCVDQLQTVVKDMEKRYNTEIGKKNIAGYLCQIFCALFPSEQLYRFLFI